MARETIISTIRHAQTTYTPEERYAGSIDVPLSKKGVEDCLRASHALSGMEFDVVVTSAQSRSVETARLLGFDAGKFVRLELCNERRFGVMEGLTWGEVQTLDPPVLFVEVGGALHSVNPQGGEPFEDLWERAKRLKRLLFRRYAGGSILVVGHGVFLQMFHGVLRSMNCIESLAAYPSNLELTRFHFRGRRLVEESVLKLAPPGGPDF